jgi:hypothetical protein
VEGDLHDADVLVFLTASGLVADIDLSIEKGRVADRGWLRDRLSGQKFARLVRSEQCEDARRRRERPCATQQICRSPRFRAGSPFSHRISTSSQSRNASVLANRGPSARQTKK